MSYIKYKSLTNLTLKNIVRRRLRSILTIISVTIGIAAVIALVLLSDGLFNAIQGQFEKMGVNSIFVMPINFMGGPPSVDSQRLGTDIQITMNDVKTISNIAGVKEAYGFSFQNAKIEFNKEEKYQMVYIAKEEQVTEVLDIMGVKLREGTGLAGKQGRKVSIGAYVADSMFSRQVKIGDTIKIDDFDCKVVGIFEYLGDQQNDSAIYMTRELAEDMYKIKDNVNEVLIKTYPTDDPSLVKERIQNKLEKTHKKDTFIVVTAQQVLTVIKSVLNVLKIILTAIAGISIVVGSIGIMNSIYTSVLERTKEIGVLKSIGAKPKDINYIFISESVILSLIGGVLGLGLGIVIAKAVELYTHAQNLSILSINITWSIVLLAIGLALLTGFLAGILPARRAEHMNTVDALKNKY